ncbi:MAG: DUF3332 domain-containing protein [Spirochaetia bacterium]|nr:DUF3332 domain-containing protein [Spirochaetia bacterium]
MKFIKSTALLSGAAILFSTFLNCYGNFGLTKFIYKFNGEIGAKFGLSGLGERLVNTIVMWVFGLFFVYTLAMAGDLIILNLIEFWTGKPINLGHKDPVKHKFDDGSSMELSYEDKGKTMVIHTVDANKVAKTQYVFRNQPGKFFNKIDGKFVEVKMKQKEKDAGHFEIVYDDGIKKNSVIVSKERVYAMQYRAAKTYELAMKKKNERTTASVPSFIHSF